MLLNKKETKLIGDRVHLVPVSDGEQKKILGHNYTFFDIGSTKAKQLVTCVIWGRPKADLLRRRALQ